VVFNVVLRTRVNVEGVKEEMEGGRREIEVKVSGRRER